MEHLSIAQTVKTYPSLPYQTIKDDILGKHYVLSVTFIGAERARTLNRTHRGKDYVPNVLSFPLDAHHGEIFITPHVAQKESKKHGMSARGYIAYLFIHGLLHLKGHRHGATMEKAEKRYISKYKIK